MVLPVRPAPVIMNMLPQYAIKHSIFWSCKGNRFFAGARWPGHRGVAKNSIADKNELDPASVAQGARRLRIGIVDISHMSMADLRQTTGQALRGLDPSC